MGGSGVELWWWHYLVVCASGMDDSASGDMTLVSDSDIGVKMQF